MASKVIDRKTAASHHEAKVAQAKKSYAQCRQIHDLFTTDNGAEVLSLLKAQFNTQDLTINAMRGETCDEKSLALAEKIGTLKPMAFLEKCLSLGACRNFEDYCMRVGLDLTKSTTNTGGSQ